MAQKCDIDCPHEENIMNLAAKFETISQELRTSDRRSDEVSRKMIAAIQHNAALSLERHGDTKEMISDLKKDLSNHMINEEREIREQRTEAKLELKEALAPIMEGLKALRDRWWSMAIYLIGAMGASIVGLLTYLWSVKDAI